MPTTAAKKESLAALKTIASNGDCFYQAVVEAFLINGDDVLNYEDVVKIDGEDGASALRRTAAVAVTEDLFNDFKLYQEAGLEDFQFMASMDTVEEVRDKILVSGLKVGSKHCLWANEFEIRAVCKALDICCLILDFDTKDIASKYVRVGEAREKFVVLQRSGEHYSLVYRREAEGGTALGVVERKDLAGTAKKNWKIDQGFTDN